MTDNENETRPGTAYAMVAAHETRTAGKVETFAKAVAEHLDGWTAVESEHGQGWWDLRASSCPTTNGRDLETYEAARLTVRRQHNDPGRVTVTGTGPAGWTKLYLNAETLGNLGAKATFSLDDDRYAAHARRITSRILSRYLPTLAGVVQRLADDRDAAEQQRVTAAELHETYGGHLPSHSPGTVYPAGEYVRAVELNHDGSAARIELYSVPIDLVRKVLDALSGSAVVLTRDQLTEWAGRALTTEETQRLGDAIPWSSVPEAVETIVSHMQPGTQDAPS